MKGEDKMPGRDRTGPMGQGPFSGRGFGDCEGYDKFGDASQIPRRGFGMGWGGGRGYGWGGGRGYGWGGGRRRGFRFSAPMARGSLPYYEPLVPTYDQETEAKLLREQATRLKDALDQIEKRLEDFEKE
jgi:hypothetical protein